MEDDEDLKLFRETSERYTTKEFLFVTFTSDDSLFSEPVLKKIAQLRDEIKRIKLVDSVISLIDVPLVRQFEGSLSDVADNVRTIEGGDVNLEKAKQELLTSPIYKELVISKDGNTTALLVNLKDQPEFRDIQRERNRLLIKSKKSKLDVNEISNLNKISLSKNRVRLSKVRFIGFD